MFSWYAAVAEGASWDVRTELGLVNPDMLLYTARAEELLSLI
jgi:hypothetical protein